jgi:hypothetical protein
MGRRLKELLEFIGALVGVISVIIGAVEYFFEVPIFYDASKNLSDRFNAQVLPLVVIADEGSEAINAAIEKNDAASFNEAVQAFVREKSIQGQIINGIEATEELIACHISLLCKIENYGQYEQRIHRFWYSYRPFVVGLRGKTIPAQFGTLLEQEAKRILELDRARGYLPK